MQHKKQTTPWGFLLITGGLLTASGIYFYKTKSPSLMENMQMPPLEETTTPETVVEVIETLETVTKPSSAPTILEISTPEELQKIVNTDRPAVIKFHAHWCGACNHLGTYYQEVADTVGPDVDFYSINVDTQDLNKKAEELGIPKEKIMYLPTVVLLHPGKVHEQMTGAPQKEALIEKINSTFKK